MRGIRAIVDAWREPFDGHPPGHHTANFVIREDDAAPCAFAPSTSGPGPGRSP